MKGVFGIPNQTLQFTNDIEQLRSSWFCRYFDRLAHVDINWIRFATVTQSSYTGFCDVQLQKTALVFWFGHSFINLAEVVLTIS